MKEMLKKATRMLLAVAAFVLVFGLGANDAKAYGLTQSAQTENSVTFSWNPYSSTSYSLLNYSIGYGADSKTAEAMAIAGSVTTNSTSYTISGLSAGTQYYVRVYANRKDRKKGDVSQISVTLGYIETLPGQVTGVNQEMWWRLNKSVDVTWDKQSAVDGYIFTFMSENGSVIEKKKVTGTRYSHQIDNKKIYKGICQAYSVIGGTTYYGKESKTAFFMTQPAKKGVRELGGKISGKNLTVNWEKVKGINKYNVYIATKKGGSFKKVKTVNGNKTSAKITKVGKKKISSKKTYYVYVEGIKKVGGETYTTGLLYITPISRKGASSPIYYTSWNN